MSTGFGPTSSAVGMFEPVTMTRSAVALAPGKRFPWASRAPAAAGTGEGTCAGTLKTMARKIASRTALLRNNPHSGSWMLFIFLFSSVRRILKSPQSVQCFFCFIFYLRRDLYNCQNSVGADAAMLMLHAANWHRIKNRVYIEDGNCC